MLEPYTRLFSSRLPDAPVPARYAQLDAGFHEVAEDGGFFYLYVLEAGGERHVLEQQHFFRPRERVLFAIVTVGFALAMLASWLLGRAVSGRVIAPVTRLARQVRNRDPLHRLAPEYADDEVGDLAAAFDDALVKLRRALAREQFFTGDVSHELRTPLMVIASSCELLDAADLPPAARNRLARISRAARDMREQVETLLLLARETPRMDSAEHSATLAEVAGEQAAHWDEAMRGKGLAFECTGRAAEAPRYNRILLATVMSNLLRNAWHYTESGGVRLVLEDEGFRVEDSGAGIPAAQRQRIFEPFARGDPLKGEGSGLGLSLVQRICDRQGWSIAVGESPDGGSCFRVSLGAAPR